ncbi:MAG TPA: response regulator [Polyangiaceae bacterium]|nr:response regulator [Polyangiaceae bacterium]
MTREGSEGRTILVIDEDQKVLEESRAILEGAGYRVLTRDHSAGSISAIVKEKPAIVLVELNMARLNGETIAKIINRTHPRPPIIVLFHSSLPVETLRLKSLAAGAQGYVQKTADAAEFIARIAQCATSVQASSKTRPLASPPTAGDGVASLPAPPPAPPLQGRRGQPELSSLKRREPATAARSGVVKTLFVDDDWSLLRAYRTALGTELEAEFLTSGEEATQRILSDSPPQIVVCDIIMPFVTGADLYSRAVAADASWRERFLFLTGASSTRVVIDFMNDHEGHVLFKPVPFNRLLEAIRQLDSRAGPRTPGPRRPSLDSST